MKKLFLSLVALVMATMSYAQSTLVATLSHGDDISMYYGAYALRDAHNAAQSGDIINLSGGSFQAVNITKAVTLRGTGINDANPTYIINDFGVNIPSSDSCRLSMEGIKCTGKINISGSFANPYFIKCKFNEFEYNSSSSVKNSTYVDCKITGNNFSVYGNSSVQCINCFVTGCRTYYNYNGNGNNGVISFINCLVKPYVNGYVYADGMLRCSFLNSVLFHTSQNTNYWVLPSTCHALNCIAIGGSGVFNNIPSRQNCWGASFQEVFKDFTGGYSDSQTFELTDEAKTKYLGTDSTEVGMYGGVLPYDVTPSYPQITKMNVANKTTADGKLSVEIEVSATE